jgi:EF hand domain-containing protein
MRSTHRLPTSAFLAAALVLAGMAVAQPPDRKQKPPRGLSQVLPDQPNPIRVDDIVERVMSFDKNKDGKVTKDELPERMHHLIEQGDTNKDGALDRDEVKKLAARMATGPGGFGAGGFRVDGRGPGAPGGFGVGSSIRGTGPGPALDFAFGPAPGPSAIESVVDDLKLSAKKKDQALAAVNAHEENIRKLMDQAHADLLKKMKEILSEEEFKDFQAALDRPRPSTVISVGVPDAPRPGDVERKNRTASPGTGPSGSKR